MTLTIKFCTGTITIFTGGFMAAAIPGHESIWQHQFCFTGTMTGMVAGDGIVDSYISSALSNTNVGTYDTANRKRLRPCWPTNGKLGTTLYVEECNADNSAGATDCHG